MHNLDTARIELGHEMENFEFTSDETETVFNETEQMELASELLEVNSEAELENFFGDLISKAGHAAGSFINSPTGKALGGLLKGAAKQILPVAGQALGGYLGGSQGAQIGGQLASQAANMFESEAEGEDREWEAANKLVKLAAEAVKNAAAAPGGMHPQVVATQALTEAAKLHAPELLTKATNGKSNGFSNGKSPSVTGNGSYAGTSTGAERGARSGRWIRRGHHIVLIGA